MRILVPMVTLADDMATVRERLQAVVGSEKTLPPLGAMIETPAAALTVADINLHSDFLSIGTNDLTQYTMAASRENPLVNDYFRQDHPAVLRLIRLIATEAGSVPVTICGELARHVDALPALLEMGIRNLSAAPPLVPGIKQDIRNNAL